MEMGREVCSVWILILGRREGQSRAKGSLPGVGENKRRDALGERSRDLARDTVLNTNANKKRRPILVVAAVQNVGSRQAVRVFHPLWHPASTP